MCVHIARPCLLTRGGISHTLFHFPPQCVSVVEVGGEVDSLLIEAGFLFVGLRTASNQGVIKAWNMATNQEFTMPGHTGQVLALASAGGLLFSGAQDASVRVWKFGGAGFECGAVLTAEMGGHASPVSCLCVSGPFLFSADFKGAIRVWDVAAGVLRQSVDRAHSGAALAVITDLFVWQNCLFSGSLDGRIKVWEPAAPETGAVIAPAPCYVFPEEQQQGSPGQQRQQLPGILALAGLTDPAGRAVLMASYNAEMAVRLWELPSFETRGTLSGVRNARALTGFAAQNLLISGDEQGLVKVWRWKAQPSVTAGAF